MFDIRKLTQVPYRTEFLFCCLSNIEKCGGKNQRKNHRKKTNTNYETATLIASPKKSNDNLNFMFGTAFSSDNAGDGPRSTLHSISSNDSWHIFKKAVNIAVQNPDWRQLVFTSSSSSSSRYYQIEYILFLSVLTEFEKNILKSFFSNSKKSASDKNIISFFELSIERNSILNQKIKFDIDKATDANWWNINFPSDFTSLIVCDYNRSSTPRISTRSSSSSSNLSSQNDVVDSSSVSTPYTLLPFNEEIHISTNELMDRIANSQASFHVPNLPVNTLPLLSTNIGTNVSRQNTCDALKLAASGETPSVPFIEQSSVNTSFNRFVENQFQQKLHHCAGCHEVSFCYILLYFTKFTVVLVMTEIHFYLCYYIDQYSKTDYLFGWIVSPL